MRMTIVAGLLLSLGASEAGAAVPDTGRPAGGLLADAALLQGERDGYDGQAADFAGSAVDARQYAPRVRVWLENDRDLLRLGERARVLVRTTEDAYLAVIHIDTNGDVEFIFPSSPYDDGFVQGRRTFALPMRGSGWLNVRGGYGIGYVYAIASSEPLDTHRFRDSWYRSARWDRGRNVYGDPFYAMERFERLLVRDWEYGDHDTDYYSYHVGRRYTHPRYACYDDYGSWYHTRSVYWDSCDRVRVLLISSPYYYDTRYYRGDRSAYYRRYYGDPYVERRDPEHGYKDRGRAVTVPPLRRQGDGTRDVGGRLRRQDEGGGQQEGRVQQPERTRPTFGRRSAEPAAEPPARTTPERRDEPRYVPRRTPERVERRADPPERRAEPPAERRSEPRQEPRREAPPPRSSDEGGSGRSSDGGARVRPPN